MNMTSLAGNRKVAIVGAGFVGSSIAYALTLRASAEKIRSKMDELESI